jgi:hypothetical protein
MPLKVETPIAVYVGKRVVHHVARLVFDNVSGHKKKKKSNQLLEPTPWLRPVAAHHVDR